MTTYEMSEWGKILIILGILAYVVFMTFQGMLNFKKTSKSSEAFFSADRGINPFVLVCSTAISVFSGLTFYGFPSSVYRNGIGFFSATGSFVAALMFVLIGYRLWLLGKEYGFTTPSDFLRSRYYSEGYGLFTAALLVAFIIPYVALQLITIGDGIVTTTEGMVPYVGAVAIGTICIGVHVLSGGMKSVAWMDTFHMILGLGALGLILYVLTKTHFPNGGLAEAAAMVQANPETAPILGHPGPNGVFTWKGTLNNALTGAIATVVWPHIFARSYMAKSKQNFLVMSWALPLIYMLTIGILMIIGCVLAPAILGPGFANPDLVMPTLSTKYCPPFIAFISLLCLFAFAVSTSESLLLSASSLATKDLYIRQRFELRNREIDQASVVRTSRIVVVILMVGILYVVMLKPAYITDYAYRLSSPFFAMILPATVGGLFWRKGSKEGAFAGTIGGLIVVTLFTFILPAPLGFSALLWGMAVNIILYVGISLVTKVPEEISKKYIDRVNMVIATGRESNDVIDGVIAAARIR